MLVLSLSRPARGVALKVRRMRGRVELLAEVGAVGDLIDSQAALVNGLMIN